MVSPPRRGEVRVAGDDLLLGAVGRELLFYFPREGVKALDVDTHAARHVVEFEASRANTQVSLQGESLVAWVSGGPEDSVVHWYDARTGELQRELSAGGVDALLDLYGEAVERGPISLELPSAE